MGNDDDDDSLTEDEREVTPEAVPERPSLMLVEEAEASSSSLASLIPVVSSEVSKKKTTGIIIYQSPESTGTGYVNADPIGSPIGPLIAAATGADKWGRFTYRMTPGLRKEVGTIQEETFNT